MKYKIIAFALTTLFATQVFTQNATSPNMSSGQKNKPPAVNSSIYYENCTDARNKGAAPIYRGEPGYRRALDRDNDGVACEPYKSNQ